MERVVLFTKQPANLPMAYTHDDGVVYHPGCGIAAQTNVGFERVGRCREIDIVFDGVWTRADIVAVARNRDTGVDIFYNNARLMTVAPPARTRGPGFVRYIASE